MTKLFRLTLAGLVLAISLVACGQDDDGDDDRENGSEDGGVPAIIRVA